MARKIGSPTPRYAAAMLALTAYNLTAAEMISSNGDQIMKTTDKFQIALAAAEGRAKAKERKKAAAKKPVGKTDQPEKKEPD
jgi:hypothetical protein